MKRICSVEGCGRSHYAGGVCFKHHWRLTPIPGEEFIKFICPDLLDAVIRYARKLITDPFTDYSCEQAWRRACIAHGLPSHLPLPKALADIVPPSRTEIIKDLAQRRPGPK